nr:uncharacterized protein LOC129384422 [Dermacentor andersoni]
MGLKFTQRHVPPKSPPVVKAEAVSCPSLEEEEDAADWSSSNTRKYLTSYRGVAGPSWTWAVPPILVVLLFGLLLAFILIPARHSAVGTNTFLPLYPEVQFLKDGLPTDSQGTGSTPEKTKQRLRANASSQLTKRITTPRHQLKGKEKETTEVISSEQPMNGKGGNQLTRTGTPLSSELDSDILPAGGRARTRPGTIASSGLNVVQGPPKEKT